MLKTVWRFVETCATQAPIQTRNFLYDRAAIKHFKICEPKVADDVIKSIESIVSYRFHLTHLLWIYLTRNMEILDWSMQLLLTIANRLSNLYCPLKSIEAEKTSVSLLSFYLEAAKLGQSTGSIESCRLISPTCNYTMEELSQFTSAVSLTQL
ncbi:hypothetical protein CHUAL_011395 [Chamberlinius hualienensis]